MFTILPHFGKSRETRRWRRGRAQRRWNPARLEVLEDRLALSGTSYYVAVSGNDHNNGMSPGHAFATIQQGLDKATKPGDVVYVEGGTYNEQLTLTSSGTSQNPITLTNYNGEHVVVNGSGLSDDTAIDIYSASFVSISGLEIENDQNGQGQDAEGVTIEGNASHVTLSDDVIQDVKGQGAYGIFVNGTIDTKGTLSNLNITGNQVSGIESNDSGGAGTYGIYLYDPTNGTPNITGASVTANQVYNLNAGNANDDCSGLRVEGAASNVTLANNVIYEVNGYVPAKKGKNIPAPEAMGITIYGTSTTAVSKLTITQNQIFNCNLGESEALTLNGNIDGFQVTNNLVRDVTNIGIDCIGGDTSINSKGIPARNGTVSGNTVYNAHSSYGGGYAAGIYVDGGQNIVLTDNITHDNDIGLEVGAENRGVTASGITVSDNLIYHNAKAGLAFGGYQASVGRVSNCYFVNNTVYGNDTLGVGDGQLWIQDASNCVVANNIFDAVGNEVLIASYPDVTNTNIQLGYNLYYTPLGANDASAFTWNNNSYSSFTAYQHGSHQDAHSLFASPKFVNTANANFALAAGSPALGAGTSKSLWYAPQNFNGQTRPLPPNLGAY